MVGNGCSNKWANLACCLALFIELVSRRGTPESSVSQVKAAGSAGPQKLLLKKVLPPAKQQQLKPF